MHNSTGTMEITICINKQQVYEEVMMTTEYMGSKATDAETTYERMSVAEDDKNALERFWNESKNTVCNSLKRMLTSETEDENGVYNLRLGLSEAFDTNLTGSMQSSLFSFFVLNITSKWCNFMAKNEANGCALEAATYMDDFLRKALHKKRPTRPTYQ